MSFTGLIADIPIGREGLVGSKNVALANPAQLSIAENLTFEDGTMRKEGGATKYNSTVISGAPDIIGGHDWHPVIGTQRMVVLLSDGDLQKDSGAGDFTVTLKAGLTVSGVVPTFVEGGNETGAADRKLFLFTGVNQVQVLAADGNTTSDLTTPPADWSTGFPLGGFVHEDRLWGFGGEDSHRVYYSTVEDHEDFTGAGSGQIGIYSGEGEEIVGGISFKGLILLWKRPFGMYIINTTDTDVTKWKVSRISKSFGLVTPQAFAAIDDDIVFMDLSGALHLVSTIDEFGNIGSRSLTDVNEMNTFIRDNVNLTALSDVRSFYYIGKRELHFALPKTGDTVNGARLVLDFNTPDAIKFRWSPRDTATALWLKRDSGGVPRPVMGDDAGFVWNLDQAVRSKDGVGYNAVFKTFDLDLSHLDPKLATVRKSGAFLELVADAKGEWDLLVDIFWDGVLRQTLTFNMGSTGAALGSFVIGTDVLAGKAVLNKKRRVLGSGRRISFQGRNTGVGQDFSISKMLFHFTISDERLAG